jgi:hypothetical protein
LKICGMFLDQVILFGTMPRTTDQRSRRAK